MSIVASVQRSLAPIHPEGYVFVGGFAAASLVLGWIWGPLGYVGWILTAWCAYFFRDPKRVTPLREGAVVSPADGRIETVGYYPPPPELELGDRPLLRVSIFMNVFDCHINRAPMAGKVVRVAHRPGLFLSADLDKASDDNERNGMVIEAADASIAVVQIAGLIARRIVCFVRPGGALRAGERFGLIRFGSRVDVYLPEGAKTLVGVGQRAIAGETVIADLKAASAVQHFRTD
jgi:phosphatidylserine decarboxylase